MWPVIEVTVNSAQRNRIQLLQLLMENEGEADTKTIEAYLKYGYDLGLRAAQEAAWSGVGGSAKLAADAIESIA